MDCYQNNAEIEAVVQRFESCATSKEDFKHRSHLTVAVWYLLHSTPDDALKKMRSGLFRFLEHHGVGREKYHETLTVFWIKLVQHAINEADQSSFVHTTNDVLERLANPRIVFEYYSEACLKSDNARSYWVEPDLKQF
ncbi:MAG TPA: hypothetical protein VNO50_09095 [Pyrinomonadaceae bacterium]|nr:hypothetical protein [Pyrinomonadaceae bacterium]